VKINLTIVVLFLCTMALSQPAKFTHIEDADEHLKHHNYLMAIPVYRAELKKDWTNVKVMYKLGICYLNIHQNREESIPLLEEASKDPKTEDEVWMHLGKAYLLTNRIDDAIACFEKYKQKYPKKPEVLKRLDECANAHQFMRTPSKVTFQNLGSNINSDEPDYNPFADKDENFLMFTSRRKDNIGGKKLEVDGYRNSDIYQCVTENGTWSIAKNAGRGINGSLDEQITGMRADGMEVYMYVDHIDRVGDIYYAARKDGGITEFTKPKPFDDNVNDEFETSGCVTPAGDVIFFGRKAGNKDNIDLYMCRRLPNGLWGEAKRLPDEVNTKYNEDMPFLSDDGKTFYFASEGHNSMGGYDLYKCTWNQHTNTFSYPENLGYPINSTDDDKSICVTSDNNFAYVSSYRPNGIGDLDIYRIRLNNTDPVSVVFTGNIFLGDTIPSNQPSTYAVSIIVTDVKTNYEYTFVPHSRTGRLVMALPAGVYKLTAFAKGYVKYKEDLLVEDIGKAHKERTKNILMTKVKKQVQ
jgi:hypothetical protein